MANFDLTYKKVMTNEGGYTNNKYNPNDKGGETYKGISRRWHPTWAGWVIIDRVKNERRAKGAKPGYEIDWNEQLDIYELKLNVKNFYKSLYLRMWGDKIHSQQIADIMYDLYVMTDNDAVKIAQRVLNGMGIGVVVDGAMGNQTVTAINRVNEEVFWKRYREAREAYHRIIGVGDQADNLDGWLARLERAFPEFTKKKTSWV